MILHKLIKKICNGSAIVLIEDVMRNLIESLCNLLNVCGEDHESTPWYMEAHEHKYEMDA